GNGRDELFGVDAVELLGQILDCVGGHLGDLPDAVFVALQVLHLLVEDLPGKLARLLQDHAAVLGGGVIAEVGAFIDEALAGGVDHDGERIGVLLELVADREVAELGRVHLPPNRVAARPVAARARADLKRHADSVAGVEAGAAHLGEVPAGAEIAGAPFRVGLEATAGEYDRLAVKLAHLAVVADAHALDAGAVREQVERAGAVADLDAALLRRLGQHVDKAGAAADRFDGKAAPELELALDLERLAAVDRDEAYALLAHPVERIKAARNQELDQVGIGAVLRHPRHVVEELLGRVGAEVGGVDLGLGEVGDQRLDVPDAVVDYADRAGGDAAVAARFLLRRGFEHHYLGALLLRRQRRAERRIAAAHHDDVILRHCPSTHSPSSPRERDPSSRPWRMGLRLGGDDKNSLS